MSAKSGTNILSQLYHIESSKHNRLTNSVDPDEAAHNELPHRDLCCLQIELHVFLFWAL